MLWSVALVIALSIYLSIVGWARERRLERESFYEQEISRRMLEKEGASPEAVMAWLRDREETRARRRLDSIKLAAILCCGLGIGMLAGLRGISRDHTYWPLGFVVLMAGLALLVYAPSKPGKKQVEEE